MAKNKFFRVGKLKLDAQGIGAFVREDLERGQEQLLEEAKNAYVEELENLLDKLSANSALRGIGFYAVRYNDPFGNAKVVVKKTRTGYQIFVDDKRFQYLDEGRPERTVTKTVKFPVYVGRSTIGVSRGQSGHLSVGSPAHIVALDGPADVEIGLPFTPVRKPDDFLGSDIQEQKWVELVPGRKIRARKPRGFYIAIKKIVDKKLFTTSKDLRNALVRRILKTSIERR